MKVFEGITKLSQPNAHGEVGFFRIEDGEPNLEGFTPVSPPRSGLVVGHSESGHHHVLAVGSGAQIMEREEAGMKILYAILEEPTRLFQADASDPHKEQTVQPGRYIIPNNVDYDPWAQQARRVAD